MNSFEEIIKKIDEEAQGLKKSPWFSFKSLPVLLPTAGVLAFLAGWGVPAVVMNIKEAEQLKGEVSTSTGVIDLVYYKYDPPFDGQDLTVAETHHSILMQRPDFFADTEKLLATREGKLFVNKPRLKAYNERVAELGDTEETSYEETNKSIYQKGEARPFVVNVSEDENSTAIEFPLKLETLRHSLISVHNKPEELSKTMNNCWGEVVGIDRDISDANQWNEFKPQFNACIDQEFKQFVKHLLPAFEINGY